MLKRSMLKLGEVKSVAAMLLLMSSGVAVAQTGIGIAPREVSSPGEAAVSCKSIRTAAQLNAIRSNLAGNYCLANDIDAAAIASFAPIGTISTPFTGKLFGNNHVISNLRIKSDAVHVGLFGYALGATIQDLGLINVNITATAPEAAAGGLAGSAMGSGVKRVFTAGEIRCLGVECYAGGIAGVMFADGGIATLSDSWSSAEIRSGYMSGGVVGLVSNAQVSGTYATGAVSCTRAPECIAGGLLGYVYRGSITRSFAVGAVAGTDGNYVGGLIGHLDFSRLIQSFATGQVSGGKNAAVGGLIGTQEEGSTTSEVYAAGRVSGGAGAALGGLIGATTGTSVVLYAYWDTVTTGQDTSAGGHGAGLTTAQLRTALPPGFGSAWAITKGLSYPFLNDADIELAAPLATLVDGTAIYTLLPIGQRVQSEYLGKPTHTDEASLAAVYTMIARAIGITRNVPSLKGVKIDKYFWNDRTRTATWRGPVAEQALPGRLVNVPGNIPITTNVIGQLKARRLVILRGTYTKSGGDTGTHWMLATLYTRDSDGALSFVIAYDPWTGQQVAIDPNTKKVITPENVPLSNFKVDGYQPVVVSAE